MRPAFMYESEGATADTADTEWWKQFDDPVLDALIDEALAHNHNLEVAAANVEQAAGVLTQTRSQLFPQVGYQGIGRSRCAPRTAGVNPEFANLSRTRRQSYQALLTATWEIDLWGRIRRLCEAARANLLASDEAQRAA